MNYLQWHVDKLRTSGGRASRAKSDPLSKILWQAPRWRKKQPAQVFAQIFRDRIDEQLKLVMPPPLPDAATADDIKAYQTLKLGRRTKLIYTMWKEADKETRKAVFVAKEKMDCDAGFVSDDDQNTEGQESFKYLAKETGDAGSTVSQINSAEMQK